MHALRVRVSWFPVLLIFMGTVMLLHRLHVVWLGWPAVLWLLVMIGGGVKLYNGLVMKSRGGVFWGLWWFALGGAFLLHACGVLFLYPGTAVAGVFFAAGAGMLLMFFVAPRDWYILVPAFCFLLLGGAILSTELGWLDTWDVVPVVRAWWPAGLILFGGALLLNRRKMGADAGPNAPPASSNPSPPQP